MAPWRQMYQVNRLTYVSLLHDRREKDREGILSTGLLCARCCTKDIVNPFWILTTTLEISINRNIISILEIKELRIKEIYQFHKANN